MHSKQNMENWFKESLNNAEVTNPASDWSDFEKKLDGAMVASAGTTSSAIWRYSLLLILIMGVSTATWLWISDNTDYADPGNAAAIAQNGSNDNQTKLNSDDTKLPTVQSADEISNKDNQDLSDITNEAKGNAGSVLVKKSGSSNESTKGKEAPLESESTDEINGQHPYGNINKTKQKVHPKHYVHDENQAVKAGSPVIEEADQGAPTVEQSVIPHEVEKEIEATEELDIKDDEPVTELDKKRMQHAANYPSDLHLNFWENPAITGVEGRNSIHLAGSMFYPGINYGNPHFFSVGFSRNFEKAKSGIGASLYLGSPGAFTYQSFKLSYAGKVMQQEKSLLQLGISGSWNRHVADFTQMSFEEKPDDLNGQKEINFFDVGIGFYYERPTWFASGSVNNLFRPSYGFIAANNTDLYHDLELKAGYHVKAGESIVISPIAAYAKLSTFNTLNGGFSLAYQSRFYGGFMYSNHNRVTLNGGMDLTKNFRIQINAGFALDSELNYLGNVNMAEAKLRYQFGK